MFVFITFFLLVSIKLSRATSKRDFKLSVDIVFYCTFICIYFLCGLAIETYFTVLFIAASGAEITQEHTGSWEYMVFRQCFYIMWKKGISNTGFISVTGRVRVKALYTSVFLVHSFQCWFHIQMFSKLIFLQVNSWSHLHKSHFNVTCLQ